MIAVQCSWGPTTPVTAPHPHTVQVESPARALMPIWVTITCADLASQSSDPLQLPSSPQYPFMLHFSEDCVYDLELRRNGQALPPLQAGWKRSLDPPNGWSQKHTGRPRRVPLHMRYWITEPGRPPRLRLFVP